MKKKTTLDDLAAMVQRGFEAAEDHRSAMEVRLSAKDDVLAEEIAEIRKTMATRDDLRAFAKAWAVEILRHDDELKELRDRLSTLESERKGRRAA